MNKYQEKKEKIRQEAIDFQTSDEPMSWGELAEKQSYFEINGKKYGLLKEFRENCII